MRLSQVIIALLNNDFNASVGQNSARGCVCAKGFDVCMLEILKFDVVIALPVVV